MSPVNSVDIVVKNYFLVGKINETKATNARIN